MRENLILEALNREKFIVIGHRGAAGYEIENTLKSIKRAISIGVDVIEVDVRATRDGKIILLHDDNFKRIAGLDSKARDLSYEEILNRVNLGDEKIPLLEDALGEVAGKVGLFIEIKEPDTVKQVIEIVKEHEAVNWVGIVSFFDDAISMARKLEPTIPTGLIYFRPPGRIFDAKKLGARIVLPRFNLATEKANKMAHKLKLFVITWTVNDVNLAKRVIKNGVDGIASDCPDKIIRLRNES